MSHHLSARNLAMQHQQSLSQHSTPGSSGGPSATKKRKKTVKDETDDGQDGSVDGKAKKGFSCELQRLMAGRG